MNEFDLIIALFEKLSVEIGSRFIILDRDYTYSDSFYITFKDSQTFTLECKLKQITK